MSFVRLTLDAITANIPSTSTHQSLPTPDPLLRPAIHLAIHPIQPSIHSHSVTGNLILCQFFSRRTRCKMNKAKRERERETDRERDREGESEEGTTVGKA